MTEILLLVTLPHDANPGPALRKPPNNEEDPLQRCGSKKNLHAKRSRDIWREPREGMGRRQKQKKQLKSAQLTEASNSEGPGGAAHGKRSGSNGTRLRTHRT